MLCPLSYEGRRSPTQDTRARGRIDKPAKSTLAGLDGVSNRRAGIGFVQIKAKRMGDHLRARGVQSRGPEIGPGSGRGTLIAKRYDMKGATP